MANVRPRYLLAYALTAVGLCSGCNSGPADIPGTIRIVSSLPRTGSAKAQTDTIINGINMALEEAGGKVGEFAIEHVPMDDATASAGQWTAELESANADAAAKDPNVMIYIGPYNSGAAKNSIPILNRANVLMISPAVTGVGFSKPGLGEPGEPGIYRESGKITFTRVVPADDVQGALGAEWAKEMGIKKVYVLDDTEVYGKGVATIFKQTAAKLGLEVLGSESIDPKQSEFSSLMAKIKALKPDLIYLGATSQTKGGQIAKDMVSSGLAGDGCKLMVPDGCFENAFIQAAGNETFKKLDCFVTFGGLPPSEMKGKGKDFVEAYKGKYGVMPEGYAVYGYEAAKVALAAIGKAGKKDREAIRAAALSIKDFDGATGKWSYDENGDTTLKVMSGNKVVDGDFKLVKVLEKK